MASTASKSRLDTSTSAGVGLFFQQKGVDTNVYVKTIVRNGSADQDGSVKAGDVIVAVDGKDVKGEDLNLLRELIIGQVGTYVSLTFWRAGNEEDSYSVSLVRGNAEYFSQLKQKSKMSGDLDRMKAALERALATKEAMQNRLAELLQNNSKEFENHSSLRSEVEESEQSLHAARSNLAEERRGLEEKEAELEPLIATAEVEEANIVRLRRILGDAEEQVQSVESALGDGSERVQSMDAESSREEDKRTELDSQEKQLIEQLQTLISGDKEARRGREDELRQLEEERMNKEGKLREAQYNTDDSKRRTQEIRDRIAATQDLKDRVIAEKDRLAIALGESEHARRIVDEKLESADSEHSALKEQIERLDELTRQRQVALDKMRDAMDSDRQDWENKLRSRQESRRQASTRHKERESELIDQLQAATTSMRIERENIDRARRELDDQLAAAEKDKDNIEAQVRAEEITLEEARRRIADLEQQLSLLTQNAKALTEEAEAAEVEAAEAEKTRLTTLEQERAMEEELQAQLDRFDRVSEKSEKRKTAIEEQRAEIRKQVVEAQTAHKKAEQDKVNAEHDLSRQQEEVSRVKDIEARRKSRMDAFAKRHAAIVSKFHSVVETQERMMEILNSVDLPLDSLHPLSVPDAEGDEADVAGSKANPNFVGGSFLA